MRSDAIDQLVSRFLERPARFRWVEGEPSSTAAYIYGGEIACDRIDTPWLEIERLTVHSDALRIVPGGPPLLELEGVEIAFTVAQGALARAVRRLPFPFTPKLERDGIRLATLVSSFAAQLEIVDGWFVLTPRHSRVLGVSAPLVSLFRWAVPLPPLPAGTRLGEIQHGRRRLTLRFRLEDLREPIGPDLVDRLQRRLLPGTSWWS